MNRPLSLVSMLAVAELWISDLTHTNQEAFNLADHTCIRSALGPILQYKEHDRLAALPYSEYRIVMLCQLVVRKRFLFKSSLRRLAHVEGHDPPSRAYTKHVTSPG